MQVNNYIDLFNTYINKDGGYSEVTLKEDLNTDFPFTSEIIFKDPLTSILKKAIITSEIIDVTVQDV
jgi:hypothetical protein